MTNPLRLPRRRARRQSVFTDPAHKAKQESRERVARAFAKYFGDMDAPKFFLLPGDEALCAKTINQHVPRAIFYGADYYKYVVECTDAIAENKNVIMQRNTVENYIRDNTIRFDAAFLDYKSFYTEEKRVEIQEFATKMLRPKAVLAVTVQRSRLTNVAQIQQDLIRALPNATIALEDHLEYRTTIPMINAIFLLTLGKV